MQHLNYVLAQLEFDYMWYKKEQILFGGREEEIIILVAGDEEGEFEDGQYEAYKMLRAKWSSIQEMLLEKILDYSGISKTLKIMKCR